MMVQDLRGSQSDFWESGSRESFREYRSLPAAYRNHANEKAYNYSVIYAEGKHFS
jgi:hypothetical protein